MKQWQDFLSRQESEIGIETVNHWLRPLKIQHYDACNLYLEARDAFQILWFEEHVRKKVKDDFLNNNGKLIHIHLALPAKGSQSQVPKKKVPIKKGSEKKGIPPKEYRFLPDEVDPLFTFANFVSHEKNLLAYRLLTEACSLNSETLEELPSTGEASAFNPIFLYGPSGCGKTHLLAATYHQLKKKGVRVVYSRAQTYVDHVIHAMRSHLMPDFRKTYRNADVLIIDDVQVFSKKSSCQEEFFHTFNMMHQEGKTIILSSDVYPQALNHVEPRLVSRFEWGIAIPLAAVDTKTFPLILKKKSEAMNFPLDPSVSEYLIQTFSSHPKALCRALEALVLRIHLREDLPENERCRVSQPLAASVLEDLVNKEAQKELTPSKVIQVVAAHYGVPVNDLLGKSQSRECALPRQVAMHLCRELLGMPFTKIGDLFTRNHSTVMTSCRQVKKNLTVQSSDLQQNMSQIQHTLHDMIAS